MDNSSRYTINDLDTKNPSPCSSDLNPRQHAWLHDIKISHCIYDVKTTTCNTHTHTHTNTHVHSNAHTYIHTETRTQRHAHMHAVLKCLLASYVFFEVFLPQYPQSDKTF